MRTTATMSFVLGFSLLAGTASTSEAQYRPHPAPPKCANGLAPKCVLPMTRGDLRYCDAWRCPVATVPRQPKVVEPKSTVPLGTAPKTNTKLK
jgi:hypothetical protein